MEWWKILLLAGGGLLAGAINSIAGGGSLLTVPLLVFAGVPGNLANGSNRVGILTSTAAAAAEFRRLGVVSLKQTTPILIPVMVGSFAGSSLVGLLADATFERVFGFLMVPVLILSLRKPKPKADGKSWPTWVRVLVFLFIGMYGGAFQAGIGLLLIVALSHTGLGLVVANSVKVLVNLAVTLVALPTFIANGNVDWQPALILAVGLTIGGALGANATVRGGEKIIRPVMIAAVIAFSGRLVGLY
ncbi:MAG: sulfite exporter TauE/SafE family protein [Acidimicrobiia bacterium]|nr:sulfite exporter TauE/SafE family protein [Acidimicrobiia bacterium]